MTGRYDEHDHEHYDRPRRHTRPRTKDRPTYDDAVDGPWSSPSTAAATPLLVDGRPVDAR